MYSDSKLIEKKHRWLCEQVEVEHPTPESIVGRELYCAREASVRYGPPPVSGQLTSSERRLDEIYKVDFHRLTIQFAQLQANWWENAADRAHVLEFFAQIILSAEHDLYLGFKDGQAVISGLASFDGSQLLISDIVEFGAQSHKAHFISLVSSCYLPHCSQEEIIVSL